MGYRYTVILYLYCDKYDYENGISKSQSLSTIYLGIIADWTPCQDVYVTHLANWYTTRTEITIRTHISDNRNHISAIDVVQLKK